MPIDQMMAGPMLDSFRNMFKECDDKGMSGEHIEAMKTILARMDTLVAEESDFNQFNAKLVGEDLFSKFSQSYGSALADEAKAASGGEGGGYDDAALLKQSVDGYKNAIQQIKDGLAAAVEEAKNPKMPEGAEAYINKTMAGLVDGDEVLQKALDSGIEESKKKMMSEDTSIEVKALFKDQALIKPLEDIVTLGESGISFPDFLRLCMEKGLDKAAEGSVVAREGLEYLLGWSKADRFSLPEIEMREEILAKFNELAGTAAFGVPDSLQMTLAEDAIEKKHQTARAKWNAIKDLWEKIIDSLDGWITAYCDYAPFIDPWRMYANPKKAVIYNQDCDPGFFNVYVDRFEEYFGLTFEDIFTLDSYINEIKNYRFSYSQERMEFLRKEVFPHCKPFNHPPKEVIKKAEKMYKDKKIHNPETYKLADDSIAFYDSVFGEGRYFERFDKIEKNDSKAAPWDLQIDPGDVKKTY